MKTYGIVLFVAVLIAFCIMVEMLVQNRRSACEARHCDRGSPRIQPGSGDCFCVELPE